MNENLIPNTYDFMYVVILRNEQWTSYAFLLINYLGSGKQKKKNSGLPTRSIRLSVIRVKVLLMMMLMLMMIWPNYLWNIFFPGQTTTTTTTTEILDAFGTTNPAEVHPVVVSFERSGYLVVFWNNNNNNNYNDNFKKNGPPKN